MRPKNDHFNNPKPKHTGVSMPKDKLKAQAEIDRLSAEFYARGGKKEEIKSGFDDINKRIPETTASYIF